MFNQVIKHSDCDWGCSTCCDSEGVIWETNDPAKYASKVFTSMGGYTVSIYLMSGEIEHFERWKYGPWIQISHRITLFLDETSSTIYFDFVHDGEKRTFTAKPGFIFSKVKLSRSSNWTVCGSGCCGCECFTGKVFWKARRDEECSTKVVVYGVESSIKNINIFQNNGNVVHFHKVKRKWITTTPFVMDININKDNDLFEYRSTRGFGHFNPKANLTVQKIMKKNLNIWTAAPEDQGLKVVLMGAKKEEKHISVLLQSGNFVLLRKTGKGKPWENITQSKHNFSGVKMYSLDEATSQYKELTTDDYEPIVYESRYGYEVGEGVKCVKITNNGMLMWSHTAAPNTNSMYTTNTIEGEGATTISAAPNQTQTPNTHTTILTIHYYI